MFAIIESGGKQFRVEEGSEILVEKLADAQGDITLDKVLMVGGGKTAVGAPYVDGATVTCEVLGDVKADKVLFFRKWRRNDSRKKQGHRQPYTKLKVKAISA